MRPLPDFGLVPRTSVTVVRPVQTGTDAFNAPIMGTEEEQVEGVVAKPASTSDLEPERPEGARVDFSFAFPKGYAKSLKGCSIVYAGRTLRVIGDPSQHMADAVPDPWGMIVECEAVYG